MTKKKEKKKKKIVFLFKFYLWCLLTLNKDKNKYINKETTFETRKMFALYIEHFRFLNRIS